MWPFRPPKPDPKKLTDRQVLDRIDSNVTLILKGQAIMAADLTNLTNSLNNLATEVTAVQGDLTGLSAAIAALSAGVGPTQAQIDALQAISDKAATDLAAAVAANQPPAA